MFVSKYLISCYRHMCDKLWCLFEIHLWIAMYTYNNDKHSSIVMTSFRYCMRGGIVIQLFEYGRGIFHKVTEFSLTIPLV